MDVNKIYDSYMEARYPVEKKREDVGVDAYEYFIEKSKDIDSRKYGKIYHKWMDK